MLVLSPQRTNAEESIHGRPDRRDPARVGCWREGFGPGAVAQRERADPLSLETEVRRTLGERGQALAGVGRGESPAQAPRCGPGVEPPDRERFHFTPTY